MRVVVRFLFIGSWLAWARLTSMLIGAGVRFWPGLARMIMACVRAWRVTLAVLIGVPVSVGWPLLFWLVQAEPEYKKWLQGIAIPWWIVLGVTGLLVLVAGGCERPPPGRTMR